MAANRAIAGLSGVLGALAFVTSVATPVSADAAVPRKRVSGASGISLPSASGIGSFTPASADPRRAALARMSGLNSSGFRFTPSAAPGSRRAVTVAVRARAANARIEAQRAGIITNVANLSLAPSAYSLGVSVGWKKFALSGDFARTEGNILPIDNEAIDLGVSFANRKWSTKLQLGADRAIGGRPSLLGADQTYSVDLGGAYALTRNLDLAGGLRYKTQRERIDAIADQRRDSQAVYIGTAFRF
ncbi:porin [Sphingomonas montana]|uniref:porin n=1 Tax=Sphingomonas montana TaxID=1843236 RepID=UPI00096EED58|nr:porin [Sphingomonas montana]